MIQTLHDNVGHILTRSILYVDILLRLDASLKDTHKEIRASIYNTKDNLTNLALLKEILESKNKEIDVVFSSYLLFSKLTKNVQTKIIQTIKEFKTNMKKHSNGNKLTVLLFEENKFLNFILFDNSTLNKAFKEGMGIQGIRNRALPFTMLK